MFLYLINHLLKPLHGHRRNAPLLRLDILLPLGFGIHQVGILFRELIGERCAEHADEFGEVLALKDLEASDADEVVVEGGEGKGYGERSKEGKGF